MKETRLFELNLALIKNSSSHTIYHLGKRKEELQWSPLLEFPMRLPWPFYSSDIGRGFLCLKFWVFRIQMALLFHFGKSVLDFSGNSWHYAYFVAKIKYRLFNMQVIQSHIKSSNKLLFSVFQTAQSFVGVVQIWNLWSCSNQEMKVKSRNVWY